jgi:radical SAM-linked protein
MTKIRVRFTKHGAIRYIGHLDVMRYFQKTIRRAKINVSYSGGFSPHQIMTFAAPLGVGLESDGEYMDLGLEDEKPDTASIMDALNQASVPEIRILSVKILPEDAGNAMASVFASEYEISFYDDKKSLCPDKITMQRLIDKSNTLETMIYHKETKKTSRDIDLKSFIYSLYLKDDNADKPTVCMTINSSSSDSIKPGFVMEYLCSLEEIKLPDNSLQITRLDMFTQNETGELVSLGDIGITS